MVAHTPCPCPVCSQDDTVQVHEHLGSDGHFCVCGGPEGCGASFILTHSGEITDIF